MRKFKSIIHGIRNGFTKRQNSMDFTDRNRDKDINGCRNPLAYGILMARDIKLDTQTKQYRTKFIDVWSAKTNAYNFVNIVRRTFIINK